MSGRNPANGASEAAQEAPDAVAGLLARVEALEGAVEALADQFHELRGPDGCLVTGSVVVVDEYRRPVVVLSAGPRQVEVLDKGTPGAWIQVDPGRAGLHLQHLTASAVLHVRGGVSPGVKASNGAKLHLADGGAGVELRAEHRQGYAGAGYQASGRADLRLQGADVGGRPGAQVSAAACSTWADVNVESRFQDEDRTSRLGVHVEQESLADPDFEQGAVDVEVRVPDPPAWAR